jgi:hypothetical protein
MIPILKAEIGVGLKVTTGSEDDEFNQIIEHLQAVLNIASDLCTRICEL